MTENQTPAAAKATTTRHCTCGCGLPTSSSKTMYRPGHDARHAGMVARAIVEAHISGRTPTLTLADLPTANLVNKADAMSKRLLAKAEALAVKELAKKDKQPADRKPSKAKKAEDKAIAAVVAQEEATHEEQEAAARAEREADIAAADEAEDLSPVGEVKVGRWTYPAKAARTADGEVYVVRNTKRDGSGEWVAYDPR